MERILLEGTDSNASNDTLGTQWNVFTERNRQMLLLIF